ncbi:MAG: hypothetical protein UV60_C0030G0003 [Parcubacteria group bacterium GW2011_GWA2_43_11]|nr:MAG: hypothetical protein UV60_C0030G0003 [Parcubacteria group bacterium GW2011_GWA2_43_11]
MKEKKMQTAIPGKLCVICKTQLVAKTTVFVKDNGLPVTEILGRITGVNSRVCCPNPNCGLMYDYETLLEEVDIDEICDRR